MKGIVPIAILITLLGCAVHAGRSETFDRRGSDYRNEIMMKCGEVAGMLGDGDPELADKLYGRCLFDMNVTI